MKNPFMSRSTILATECLVSLLILNFMAWKSGWYNSEFALVSVYILKEILQSIFSHQLKGDTLSNENPTPKPTAG